MTNEEIKSSVNRIFEEGFEINPDDLHAEAHIFNDLGLDSLDIVDLIVMLQKEFKVQVREDERLREIRTVGDLYNYLETLKKEQEAANSG